MNVGGLYYFEARTPSAGLQEQFYDYHVCLASVLIRILDLLYDVLGSIHHVSM